ncbi:MAG: dienelactone hydrolase family protein [Noviherbaspirillum sp.]
MSATQETLVKIPSGQVRMEGMLELPQHPAAIVLFAHGSGSSRKSPRNNYVARVLRDAGMGTLLLDLLTLQEDEIYRTRFNIALLTERLQTAAMWLRQQPETRALALGVFGASTGAAAALQLAALPDAGVQAVVSRGGRPDLAGIQLLAQVSAPTLLIVGGWDDVVLELNRAALDALQCQKQLVVIPGATHLFEEPGKLEAAAELARDWFLRHLTTQTE